MNQLRRDCSIFVVGFLFWLFQGPSLCSAYDCATSDMSNGNNCLFYGAMGSVSGIISSDSNKILASNMHPWQQGSSDEYWHTVAVSGLNEGNEFRNSLVLLGATQESNPSLWQMLAHKEQNYETAGFISFDISANPTSINSFSASEKLSNAIATFAYEVHIGKPDAENNLREAIKVLANIYLMIGDEFLIDALEWRFSSQNLTMNAKLDEQILLLKKAQLCYAKAISVFVHGFSPAVGTSIYISNSFDAVLFNIFNLAVERSSIAMQEKTSKELARQLTPTSVATTMETSKEQLRDAYTNTYLLTAAVAQKQDISFPVNGGERLNNALKSLNDQSRKYSNNLNPLGYDDRYVPMQDFATLYGLAREAHNSAVNSNSTFINEDRDFDNQIDVLKSVHNNIATNVYRERLSALTGIALGSITPATLDQVTAAGEDLYDCEIDNENFLSCITGKTSGVIGSKYQEIRNAQVRIDQALLRRAQTIEKIEMENNRFNKSLEIENKYNSTYKESVEAFSEKLKGARSIQRVITKTKGLKKKENQTITSYMIQDPSLNISTDKEIRLQELMNDYKIVNIQTSHEVDLMNFFHGLAEIEMEIGLSVQLKNSTIDDFENTLKERDNLVFLYTKSNEYYQETEATIIEKIVETRILRSEAALKLAYDLNNAVNKTYLAAKALEYKYLTPLVNITMDEGQNLNISDLYKIQTVGDLNDFQLRINNYDTCSWGTVSPRLYRISLAKDILGLTDSYLESLGALTATDKNKKRYELLQQYIADKIDNYNDLEFSFSISLTDKAISQYNKYNMKIWWGSASPPCDPITARGVAVLLNTTQSASLEPYVTLTLKGAQSFLNKDGKIVEYVPVSKYLNMQTVGTDMSIITKGAFDAFINADPNSYSISDNRWTNSFKGRSLASANWSVLIEDFSYPTDINWTKLTDITFYFDAMTMQLQ